jgi:FAD/FMN-containing dehydrogenase
VGNKADSANENSKVWDFAHIHSAQPDVILEPTSAGELIQIVRSNYFKSKPLRICIAGGKYSHGGQTMLDNSLYLDMKHLNQILNLDIDNRTIKVQAGITWEQIQNYLNRFDLSVAEMQSYRNFTVGGSVSVNCHGRGMKHSTLAETIIRLKVLTSDGRILMASRDKNLDLFRAVIGGYGGIAIILEIDLIVVDNCPLIRKVDLISIELIEQTMEQIKHEPDLVFYNQNIYPTNQQEVFQIIFYKLPMDYSGPFTNRKKLRKKQLYYPGKMMAEQLLRRFSIFKMVRNVVEPSFLLKEEVVWRNYEMSYDVNELEPLFKYPTTSILQEYFLPIHHLRQFLRICRKIIKQSQVNLLNISVRYVGRTEIPILNYTRPGHQTVSIVLYLNLGNNSNSLDHAQRWTRRLIEQVINLKGSYYLPYLSFATVNQFRQAYPDYLVYLAIKKKYDSAGLLSNQMLDYYL